MRLIDIESESFLNEMRGKQDACKNLIHNSDNKTKTWTEREHWEGVYGIFVEMALTLKKQPTVDAVPLDKLCERLVNFSECPSCAECKLYGIKCGEYWPCGCKEHWKAVLTKWMEEEQK